MPENMTGVRTYWSDNSFEVLSGPYKQQQENEISFLRLDKACMIEKCVQRLDLSEDHFLALFSQNYVQ